MYVLFSSHAAPQLEHVGIKMPRFGLLSGACLSPLYDDDEQRIEPI